MVGIFVSFENILEMHDASFEVYVEDKLINKQTMQAPKEVLSANFIQTAKQIQNDKRPIKLKMIVPNVIWDDFENKERVLNNGVECSNSAMIIWEENNNIGKNKPENN